MLLGLIILSACINRPILVDHFFHTEDVHGKPENEIHITDGHDIDFKEPICLPDGTPNPRLNKMVGRSETDFVLEEKYINDILKDCIKHGGC